MHFSEDGAKYAKDMKKYQAVFVRFFLVLKPDLSDQCLGNFFWPSLFRSATDCSSLFTNTACISSFHLSNSRAIVPHVSDNLYKS